MYFLLILWQDQIISTLKHSLFWYNLSCLEVVAKSNQILLWLIAFLGAKSKNWKKNSIINVGS
jgi:hypothetical protein